MAEYRTKKIGDYEQIVFCDDGEAGLHAIIAIHSTALGPALGGCRMWPYASEREALDDALRLSRGMTYKAAMANLPFGGGKAVIIGDPKTDKTEALLRSFARMVERLGGRYVTGEDVGTGIADMDVIARETRHVAGRTGASGDPSPVTAFGVFTGIRAAIAHRTGGDDLGGVTVAVQGLGHVGANLCERLHGAGAKLIVADLSPAAVRRACEAFGARAVAPEAIYDAEADLFAPCALGGVINEQTLPRLKVGIVAGSANNQLAEARFGAALAERGILYAPDYVINAGGLINISFETAAQDHPYDRERVLKRVAAIGERLADIFRRADATGLPPDVIADALAEERLAHPRAA